MSWWRFAFEAWLIQRLLRSPSFHHGVGWVHKRVQWMKHGKPPEEMGGTTLDTSGRPSFWKHFVDEIQHQARFSGKDNKGGNSGPPKP